MKPIGFGTISVEKSTDPLKQRQAVFFYIMSAVFLLLSTVLWGYQEVFSMLLSIPVILDRMISLSIMLLAAIFFIKATWLRY